MARTKFVGFLLSAFAWMSCNTSGQMVSDPSSKASETWLIDQDRLGQIYHVDDNGLLTKYSASGDSIASYKNRLLGPVRQLDVFNPQKILLYYQTFSKALILDQSLSAELEVNLENNQGWQLECVGQSSDQMLWIYDPIDRKVKKTSASGEVALESDPITFLFEGRFEPKNIIERAGFVWLSDPNTGWLRFDLFGQFSDFLSQPHTWYDVYEGGYLHYVWDTKYWTWKPGTDVPTSTTVSIQNAGELLLEMRGKVE